MTCVFVDANTSTTLYHSDGNKARPGLYTEHDYAKQRTLNNKRQTTMSTSVFVMT